MGFRFHENEHVGFLVGLQGGALGFEKFAAFGAPVPSQFGCGDLDEQQFAKKRSVFEPHIMSALVG